jgi:coenzyme F420 hydrogenase subunit delta
MPSRTAETAPPALEAAPDYCRCETLVLGCGNVLFGDDGFGPAVADALRRRPDLPQSMQVVDAGTSARQLLFDLTLSPVRPRRLIVVDAVDMSRRPGQVWTIEARQLPGVKIDDFCMHQLPTSNLLRELNDLAGVEVRCIVAQISELPAEVSPGLSRPMREAVRKAQRRILKGWSHGG